MCALSKVNLRHFVPSITWRLGGSDATIFCLFRAHSRLVIYSSLIPLLSVLCVVTACNKSAVAAEQICTNITSATNFDHRRIIFRHPGFDNVGLWPVYFQRVVGCQGQLFCLWEKTECLLTDFNSEEHEN